MNEHLKAPVAVAKDIIPREFLTSLKLEMQLSRPHFLWASTFLEAIKRPDFASILGMMGPLSERDCQFLDKLDFAKMDEMKRKAERKAKRIERAKAKRLRVERRPAARERQAKYREKLKQGGKTRVNLVIETRLLADVDMYARLAGIPRYKAFMELLYGKPRITLVRRIQALKETKRTEYGEHLAQYRTNIKRPGFRRITLIVPSDLLEDIDCDMDFSDTTREEKRGEIISQSLFEFFPDRKISKHKRHKARCPKPKLPKGARESLRLLNSVFSSPCREYQESIQIFP